MMMLTYHQSPSHYHVSVYYDERQCWTVVPLEDRLWDGTQYGGLGTGGQELPQYARESCRLLFFSDEYADDFILLGVVCMYNN